MCRRYELTDQQYNRLQPLLSGKPGDPGRNVTDNRRFLNAGSGLRGPADANGDKAVTAKEVDQYLSEEVPYQAARQHNRKQTPQVVGQNMNRVLVRYQGEVPARER
jgi:transposase